MPCAICTTGYGTTSISLLQKIKKNYLEIDPVVLPHHLYLYLPQLVYIFNKIQLQLQPHQITIYWYIVIVFLCYNLCDSSGGCIYYKT